MTTETESKMVRHAAFLFWLNNKKPKAVTNYINNIFRQDTEFGWHLNVDPNEYVTAAFEFEKTPEGVAYWAEIDQKWQEELSNNN